MTAANEATYNRTSGPIHGWFELSYSSYQVLPRVLMQSMPLGWQERMVACLQELHEEFAHVAQPESYKVESGEWFYPEDLSSAQLRLAKVTTDDDEEDDEEVAPGDYKRTVYYDERGNEVEGCSVFLPKTDPLPHYRHGFVAPKSDGLR